MTDYLFYLLLGCGAGAIIAAFGLGLVVTYQGSGTVNFAHGAMATWTAYTYAELRNGAYIFPIPGLPGRYHFSGPVAFAPALGLSILTSAVIGLAVYGLVFRPLRHAPALARVVASVGLIVVFTSLIDRRFVEQMSMRVSPILPKNPVRFTHNLTVPRDGLWLLAIVLAITAAVWAVWRYTRLGLAIRAAAEREKGAVLLGFSPERLAALSWVGASVIAGLVAILASPLIELTSSVFTFAFLTPALGAALIGRFRFFWPTVLTGLAIGMVQSTFTLMQQDLSWFPKYGARDGLPFIIIIVAMVLLGERIPERGAVENVKLPAVPPARVGTIGVVIPLGLTVAALLTLGPLWRGAIMTSLIAAVLSLSVVVVTGFGGQISLCQMASAGIAGFTLSKLVMSWHVPFPLAPVLAALVATAFGMLVGLPALRLRGINLAIVTFAGGVAIAEFVFKNPQFVGDITTGGAKVPNPKLGHWDLGLILGTKSSRPVFGIFLVVVLGLLTVVVANIRRSASGRRMLATRSNERAAAAVGISVASTKLVMFALSSFIAGIGGTLIAYRFGSVSDLSFGTVASLVALTVAYLGGITSVGGALTAGLVATSGLAFFATSRIIHSMGPWEALIGGVLLIFTAIKNPEGIAGAVRQGVEAAQRTKRAAAVAAAQSASASTV
jgi:branched-chain amino acid transport system permease protein